MGDKKSEYEEALEQLDDGEQPLAYIEGTNEATSGNGVLIATGKRLFWFDKQIFGMKTKKPYAYADFESVKVEDHGKEFEFKPRSKGFMGVGTKDELEVENIKSSDEQKEEFLRVVTQKLAESAPAE